MHWIASLIRFHNAFATASKIRMWSRSLLSIPMTTSLFPEVGTREPLPRRSIAGQTGLEETGQASLLSWGQRQMAHLAVHAVTAVVPLATASAGVRPATFCTLSGTSGGGKVGV